MIGQGLLRFSPPLAYGNRLSKPMAPQGKAVPFDAQPQAVRFGNTNPDPQKEALCQNHTAKWAEAVQAGRLSIGQPQILFHTDNAPYGGGPYTMIRNTATLDGKAYELKKDAGSQNTSYGITSQAGLTVEAGCDDDFFPEESLSLSCNRDHTSPALSETAYFKIEAPEVNYYSTRHGETVRQLNGLFELLERQNAFRV